MTTMKKSVTVSNAKQLQTNSEQDKKSPRIRLIFFDTSEFQYHFGAIKNVNKKWSIMAV